MKKFNLHSHSSFCDGTDTLEEMALSAMDKGLYCFGFSAHAPVPFENTFALQARNVDAYLSEIRRLKEKYADKIHLYASMEFDYITDIVEDIRQRAETYGLDYVIASVHQVKEKGKDAMWFIDGGKQETWDSGLRDVFGGDIRRGVETFYSQSVAMIHKVRPDIVGHFDKIKMHNKERFFSQNDSWYKDLVMWLMEEALSENCICEVNTRGLYKGRTDDFFPSMMWIKEAARMGLRMTISTDCHKAGEVDLLFDRAVHALKDTGHKYVWFFDGEWKAEKL